MKGEYTSSNSDINVQYMGTGTYCIDYSKLELDKPPSIQNTAYMTGNDAYIINIYTKDEKQCIIKSFGVSKGGRALDCKFDSLLHILSV